ncbi:MAG: PKD domain-containing protein, partial [Bacteroidota bacterium]
GPNPTYTFQTADTTGVILTVTNSNGCQNTVLVQDVVAVREGPVADFSVDVNSACSPPLTVNFTNNSQANGATNPTYEWLFPGGIVSGGGSSFIGTTPPPVTYNADGQYDVTLIISDVGGCEDTLIIPNMIGIGGVTASFTPSATTICLGDPITFTNTSSGGVTSLGWNFGETPGTNATGILPTYTYTAPGTYTVTLEANNAQCGDTLVQTNLITVEPRPTAAFMADRLQDCQPGNPFSFTDQSTDATNWAWDFDDGSPISTQQNPNHTFTTFGSFDVTLVVSNAQGCVDSTSITIDIAPPNAGFNINPTEGCVPLTVNVTDGSTSPVDPIVSWEWSFPGGAPNTAATQNAQTVYNNPGNYSIRLVITTQNGCTDTLRRNNAVMAGTPPMVDFTVDKDTVCINEDITFTSTFTDSLWNYEWDFMYEAPGAFSPNSSNPTTTYADTGFFSIGLIIENQGCRDTLIIDSMVYVSPPDARFFPSEPVVCGLPASVSFADSSIGPIDQYEWFVNGNPYSTAATPPDLTINTPGSFFITQVVTYTPTGCTDTATALVSAGNPIADFESADTVGCKRHRADFVNLSQDANSYFWSFNFPNAGFSSTAQDPFRIYQETGIYSVRLIATDIFGCTDTLVRDNYIRVIGPEPDFSFTPDGGCPPLSVAFSDSSTSFQTTINGWLWDFGDNNTSNLQNPTHLYTAAGSYDVKLTVFDDAGCSDSLTIPNAINVTLPQPSFTIDDDSTCSGNLVNFASTSLGLGPLTYFWDFGDGNGTSILPSPSYAYQDTGSYDVKLIVTDANGCVDSITVPNAVYIEPFQANFGGNPRIAVCPPLTTTFTDSTIGNVVAWDWDFGDQTGSSLQDPQHVYFAPDLYTVTLIATHEDGCMDTLTRQDYVQLNGPNGTFTVDPPNVCLGDTICVTAIVRGTDVATIDYKDGSPTILAGLNGTIDTIQDCRVYALAGKYFPQIVLQDAQGCAFTLNSADSVTVYNLPQADISPQDTTGCLPFSVPFTDNSIDGDTTISAWFWDFGDGDTSILQNPVHIFNQDTVWDVSLVVTDDNGCVDTAVTTVTTYQGTIGDFAATDSFGCAPFTVTFSDASSNLPPTNWTWIFGDGDTLTGVSNPTHTYQNNGVYTVTLIVDDALGCSDTVVKTDYINLMQPEAIVYASSVIGCNPVTLTFFGDSTVTDTVIDQYEWCLLNLNTGGLDCQITTVDSIDFVFTMGGDYAMILTVTDRFGCTDISDTLNVTITTRTVPNPLSLINVSVLSDTSAEVIFEPYPDANFVQYRIMRADQSGNFIPVGDIFDQNTTTFIDSDPSISFENQPYCYKVLVQNDCDEFSV